MAKCEVCGRECERVRSIFRQERPGVWKSRYACDDCNRAWVAGFELGTSAEREEPAEVDGRQMALFG